MEAYADYAVRLFQSGIFTNIKLIKQIIRAKTMELGYSVKDKYKSMYWDIRKWKYSDLITYDIQYFMRVKLITAEHMKPEEVVPVIMFLFPDADEFINNVGKTEQLIIDRTCPVCDRNYCTTKYAEKIGYRCPNCELKIPLQDRFRQYIKLYLVKRITIYKIKERQELDNMASTPFKFDHVGSFLRPESLKKARRDYEAGSITAEELKSVEDEAITELIKKEKEVGLHAITDGEFRRATWHLDFMWAFDGVGHSKTETGLPFHGEAAMIDDTYLTGKIVYKTHPFIEHFKFVQQFEDEDTVAKLTIPAPAQFLEQMIMPFAWGNTKKFYDTPEQVAEDIANGYKEFIKDVYAAGCRNLQFDDCSWGMVVDPSACKFFGTTPAGLEKIKNTLLDINNKSIEGKPEDLVINTHVCRGNFHSTYASSGAYTPVADVLSPRTS